MAQPSPTLEDLRFDHSNSPLHNGGFLHCGFVPFTSHWRGHDTRFQWLSVFPRHSQQMCWGYTLSTHKAGAYAQTRESFKQELHPHISLWFRRRYAMSAALSMEGFSEPLTSWSFEVMERKSDVCPEQRSGHQPFFSPLPP